MSLEFSGDIWYWRGPAPFYFVTVPAAECEVLRDISKWVTYGWGMIPVRARIGQTAWKTSLFPKEGSYVVPIKASVRKAESLGECDHVTVRLEVERRR
jgi:hypothetical protein